ncbi:MAG: AAA family ATPase [Bacteroidota bacterium]
MPFLSRIQTKDIPPHLSQNYPFTIPSIAQGLDIDLHSNVTFLVGENGSGKSTILEAVADQCGFNPSGGNRNHQYNFHRTESDLSNFVRLSWNPVKVTQGFFLRAETFFNFATYIDRLEEGSPGAVDAYGGKSLHHQSHGESFLALFNNRFHKGIYLLDEPEAALSPQRQLTFLTIVHKLESSGLAQFIIATHSPMLLTYPGATLLSLDEEGISETNYQDTEHFQLTRRFLEAPEAYYRFLFAEDE